MALQGSAGRPETRALGYDGIDVIVGRISEHGFMAETDASFPPEAFVRLKLPGVGCVYARIVSTKAGRVSGEFVTPLATTRLQRTLGLRPALAAAG
jgi:hypothetical protein